MNAFLCLLLVYALLVLLLFGRNMSIGQLLHGNWYRDVTRFPVEAFPPTKDVRTYREIVKRGAREVGTKRVLFVGCCINIARSVGKLRERMEQLGRACKDWRLVIFENDSKDGTRERLLRWAMEDPRVHVVPCPEEPSCRIKDGITAFEHGGRSEGRMRYMTEFRDRARGYAVERFPDFDCACVLDLDLSGPLCMEGFYYSFGIYDEWDVLTAHGMDCHVVPGLFAYHDPYAFEVDDWEPEAMHFAEHCLRTTLLMHGRARRGHGVLIPVKSAFSGMALYKMDVFAHPDVSYVPANGEYDRCEHRVFHDNIRRATGRTRIFVNPNLMILVGLQGNG
jgi:hypothetical protein